MGELNGGVGYLHKVDRDACHLRRTWTSWRVQGAESSGVNPPFAAAALNGGLLNSRAQTEHWNLGIVGRIGVRYVSRSSYFVIIFSSFRLLIYLLRLRYYSLGDSKWSTVKLSPV